ncbi:hypothetical protein [Ruania alba]|uniref:Alkaline shock response membrane anchor protein AmaP n=1 Tax=Ruania alba TaxID=648782 RepID=A0A1H5LVJ5_9MICO|nr:hypothetical protein [Ruania alba]SEE80507.1 hypothetical protein SAMN04488554_2980 [Ruania alba]
MKRHTGSVVARLVALAIAIVIGVAGLFLIGVHTPWWPASWPAPAQSWTLDPFREVLEQPWGPGTAAALALLLALLVVWSAIRPFGLLRTDSHPVTRDQGLHVDVEPAAVASAAEQACSADPDVIKARLSFHKRRRQVVLEGTVTVAASADLAVVAAHVDRVAAQARDVLGIQRTAGRIRLAITRETGTRRVS